MTDSTIVYVNITRTTVDTHGALLLTAPSAWRVFILARPRPYD